MPRMVRIDFAERAAASAFDSAKYHPFRDGNRRAALLARVSFLGLNAIDIAAGEAKAVLRIRALAAGEIDEAGPSRWIRGNWPA